jgi:pimeloyl-ACP methyl ester carboxylesterase
MTTYPVNLEGAGTVEISVTDQGEGRPVLLLHGGAGPISVAGFGQMLAQRHGAHVYTPTHPGFGGTPRPEWLGSVPALARVYSRWLDSLGVGDVSVIGNSIGGWIAAEMALIGPRALGRVILVDAVGIVVEGHPITDVFPLSLPELAKLSYHDPSAFLAAAAKMTDQQRAGAAANRVALGVYGGQPSTGDPTLRGRLRKVDVPTLVLWGESDRIVDAEYGRGWATAIPKARFEVLPRAGHVPQLETPDQLLAAVWRFVEASS